MRNDILTDYGVSRSTPSATKMRLKCVTIVGSFEQHVLRDTSGKPMTAVTRGKKKTSADLSICGYLGPEVIRDYGRWMKSTERTDFRTMRRCCAYVRLYMCVYVCVCVWTCGRRWVQRKTNKAYRIDRRNPEHVRSLLLYTSPDSHRCPGPAPAP